MNLVKIFQKVIQTQAKLYIILYINIFIFWKISDIHQINCKSRKIVEKSKQRNTLKTKEKEYLKLQLRRDLMLT